MWADSSGGAGGATRPTSADDVFFDTNSGVAGASYTVILATGGLLPCRNINIVRPSATGVLTFFNSGSIQTSGSLTIVPDGVTWSATNTLNFVASSPQTITTNGFIFPVLLSFNGLGGSWQLQDNLTTTNQLNLVSGTIDINNFTVTARTVSVSGSSARSIDFGDTFGQMNVTIRSGTVWNGTTATNFSYTGNGQVNFTAAYDSGTFGVRSAFHGTSAGGGESTKAPPFWIYAGITDDTVSTGSGSHLTDLVYTTNRVGLINTARTMYGNLILAFNMPFGTGTNVTTFAGNGTQTFDSADFTTNFPITVGNGTSIGTLLLANNTNLSNARTMTLTSGTLDANGKSLTVGLFSSSGSNVRALDIGDTTMTLSGTGVVWNTLDASNLTATISNSTVLLSDDTTATKTVRLGTLPELDNIVIGGNTSTANTILLSDANTVINSITSTKTVPQTIGLNGSFTVNSWGIVGTATAPVTLTDNGSATVANLHYAGTGTVDVRYYTISYSAATPADTWYALTSNNNVNGGNNTGWIFGDTVQQSTFFLVF